MQIGVGVKIGLKPLISLPKGRFTRYDFVACDLLTTRLRHILGHDCRKVLKHVFKSYNFFCVVSVS